MPIPKTVWPPSVVRKFGKVPDSHLAAIVGVTPATVSRERQARGIEPLMSSRHNTWSDEDFEAAVEFLEIMGRTPTGLYIEHRARKHEKENGNRRFRRK